MFESEKKRIKNYREMVSSYYSVVTNLYTKFWGEHFHVAIWENDKDPLDKALRKTHQIYISDANICPNDKVIDLGCGIGALSFHIARSVGCSVLGINLCGYQIKRAKKNQKKLKIQNVRFVEADIMNLDALKEKFDAAFLIEVGQYLPDKRKAIKMIHKTLNKGARLIITDCIQKDKLNRFEKEILVETFNKHWCFPYMETLPGYVKILKNTGFKIIKAKDISDKVSHNWDVIYNIGLNTLKNLSLKQLFSSALNPEIIKRRKVAMEIIKNQIYANIFAKICADAKVLRYCYIVAEKL